MALTKSWTLIFIFFILLGYFFLFMEIREDQIIGGERDEHDCLLSAGYSWNQTDNACVREWLKPEGDYKQPFQCSSESRGAEACISLYEPVCSYDGQSQFSNSCFACINSSIEFYTQGEC
jgi:hypothetical protein